nr:MAG TPA: hypothetical protein [Bacteriophage sp.]
MSLHGRRGSKNNDCTFNFLFVLIVNMLRIHSLND